MFLGPQQCLASGTLSADAGNRHCTRSDLLPVPRLPLLPLPGDSRGLLRAGGQLLPACHLCGHPPPGRAPPVPGVPCWPRGRCRFPARPLPRLTLESGIYTGSTLRLLSRVQGKRLAPGLHLCRGCNRPGLAPALQDSGVAGLGPLAANLSSSRGRSCLGLHTDLPPPARGRVQ